MWIKDDLPCKEFWQCCDSSLRAMGGRFPTPHHPVIANGPTAELWEMSDVVDLLEAFDASRQRAASESTKFFCIKMGEFVRAPKEPRKGSLYRDRAAYGERPL
jgi:hypothetical protein